MTERPYAIGIDPDKRGWFAVLEPLPPHRVVDLAPVGLVELDGVPLVHADRLQDVLGRCRVAVVERPPVMVVRAGKTATSRSTTAYSYCRFGQIVGLAFVAKVPLIRTPGPRIWMRMFAVHGHDEAIAAARTIEGADVALDEVLAKHGRAALVSASQAILMAVWGSSS